MKRTTIATMALMMVLSSMVMAQAKFDSVSMDPPYVQPGDDVNIYVKFHEGLTKREIYSSPSNNKEKLPLGEKSDLVYMARIRPKDAATSRYVLVKDGERSIGHLFSGETWTAPFAIHVADDTSPTNYTLTFEVLKANMDGEAEGDIILSRDIDVRVNGVPKFTLDSESQLIAGQTKNFEVSIGNVGGGTARHVTVNLNATAPLTVLKSSSVYIGDMNGLTSDKVVYELYADTAAEPKAYTVPVEIKYTDRDGITQSVGKIIGVKVQGVPSVAANLDSFADMMGGTSGKVGIGVVNRGFVDAKFLSLEVLGTKDYAVTSKTNAYIGNLASDDFQTEDFTIKVNEGVTGKVPLSVRITYTEENNNEVHVETKQLELNVLSADDYYKLHPKTNGTQQIMSIAMAVPLIIAGYIVLWLLLKVVGALTGFIDKKVFRKQ